MGVGGKSLPQASSYRCHQTLSLPLLVSRAVTVLKFPGPISTLSTSWELPPWEGKEDMLRQIKDILLLAEFHQGSWSSV